MQRPPPTDDPPEFGPDSEHSWEDVLEMPPTRAQQAVDLAWSTSIGDRVYGSATVVDGSVYVTSVGHGLQVLDARTGSEQWSTDVLFGTASSPAVVGGSAYVVTVFGSVSAIDLESGEIRWETDSHGEYSRIHGFTPSALVADDLVYVGTADGALYAYDAATGDREWTFPTQGEIIASAVYYEGSVIVPNLDGTLFSVDATEGTENWSVDLEGLGFCSPTLADGTLYVGGETGNVYARAADSGEEVWTVRNDGEVVATPTVADGTVFVGDSDDLSAGLLALDAESGDTIWSIDRSRVVSSPTVAGDRVYVTYVDVAGYDVESGEREVLFTDTETGFRSSPTVVDGVLYAGARAGSVYAVNTGTTETSRGSRIRDGTFGHVGSLSGATGGVSTDATGSSATAGADDAGADDSDGGDSLVGPGIGGAVGSLLATRFLLDRTGGSGESRSADDAESSASGDGD